MLECLLPATRLDVSRRFVKGYIQELLSTTSDMHTREKKKILAVVDDLLFTVKINDAAKRCGLEVVFLKSERDVLDKAEHEKPLLIILDLNNNSVDPLDLISKLKAHGDLKKISLIGYLSHVQGELKQKAHEAGANIVMARSAFSQNLQQILKRHAGVV
jgi:PleD family two-component response regulator